MLYTNLEEAMERSQVEKFKVQCDESDCDWTQETPFSEAPNWHKKACPKCSKGEIVSDEDLAAWHGLNALLLLDEKIDPEGKLPRVDVKIDTSGLRV